MAEVRARYVPNHRSFGEFMLSAQVLDVAMKAGHDVVLAALQQVNDSDPSDKGSGDGTHYRDHFEVTPDVVTIDGNPRAAATVINDSDYAAQVEYGIGPGWKGSRVQGGTPGVPQRPLGTAGAKVGKYLGGPAAKKGKKP